MPSLSAATCHAFEGKKLAACFLSFHPVNGTTGAQTACPVTHPVARPRDHQALPQKSAGFVHIKSYESSSQPPLSLLLTLLLDLPIVPLAWPIAVMMISKIFSTGTIPHHTIIGLTLKSAADFFSTSTNTSTATTAAERQQQKESSSSKQPSSAAPL